MCDRMLGRLPCTNAKPHQGDQDNSGRGCTHDAGDVPDAHDKDGS